MGKINAFDREFSPLAPSVRALELNSVFISNGCLALHDQLTVTRFLLFWLKFKSLQKLLVGIWNIDFLCDQLVKVDFELPNDVNVKVVMLELWQRYHKNCHGKYYKTYCSLSSIRINRSVKIRKCAISIFALLLLLRTRLINFERFPRKISDMWTHPFVSIGSE